MIVNNNIGTFVIIICKKYISNAVNILHIIKLKYVQTLIEKKLYLILTRKTSKALQYQLKYKFDVFWFNGYTLLLLVCINVNI